VKISEQAEQLLKMTAGNKEEVFVAFKEENIKLLKANSKLKRYTQVLEEEIKAICCVDQCDSHKSWIERVTK